MIDWELSTIGDPMLDMGWLCGGLRDERFPDMTSGHGLIDENNAPTKQALGQYYCAGTGRDMADFDYFCILAGFKIGCVIEYKVAAAAVDRPGCRVPYSRPRRAGNQERPYAAIDRIGTSEETECSVGQVCSR